MGEVRNEPPSIEAGDTSWLRAPGTPSPAFSWLWDAGVDRRRALLPLLAWSVPEPHLRLEQGLLLLGHTQ